jgi:long-chain acyl-CoA synthetase
MKTLVEFFNHYVERYADNIYLWENRGNGYEGTTYRQTKEQVYNFAAGLMDLGIRKGDRVALLSEARNDWVISEFGILFCGGVNVPLSVRISEPRELKFRISHSGACIVIVSQNQLGKIRSIRKELPSLEKIIILDDSKERREDELIYAEVMEAGKTYLRENREKFIERYQSVRPGDYASISYTSGTTSDPKGILLTHRNYTANVEQGYSLMDLHENFTTLLILPWDHAFAHTAGIYCFMGKGASIGSVQAGRSQMESLKNIPGNIRQLRPHLLFSVPAIARSFKKNIERSVRDRGKVAYKMFSFALKVACCYNGDGWNKGKGLSFLLFPLLKIFDKIIFTRIRDGFGGRMQFFIGGGALLDIDLQRFFYAIGIPMLQGYGLTESAPFISANSTHRHKLGSSGYLVSALELRICDEQGKILPNGEQGEIVVKGENVMAGYWKNEEATRNTIKDGWLYTGDMGYMDKDGFLYVLGRYKSLLIADDGEKYSPEGMEEAIASQSSFIDQCMLYNNQDPYTIALVVVNKEAIKHFLQEKGLAPGSPESARAVLEKIDKEFREYRTGKKYGHLFPQRWIPSAIGILEESFSEENHLLNFQLKIVRGKVVERYRDRIDFLYSPEGKNILNEKNTGSILSVLS